ncbi:MAG TPA: carboxypeptidase-like regulatory domain-containing protein, partial [Longimicrobiaceae bacterium]|nr:carboxypeptidase-like regulatory domain-containing protein [Longimicrobiaceae bacterium]
HLPPPVRTQPTAHPASRRPMTPLRSFLALALLAAPLCALPLRAQGTVASRITVGGTVLDAVSGAPVPDAAITLPRLKRSVVTDAQGRFTLREIPAGTHRWVVSRLGYANWDQEVEATEDGAEFSARILARPEVLEGITVVADRFETRRRAAATAVRVADRRDILASAAANALEVIPSRLDLRVFPCSISTPDELCTEVRGRILRPMVIIDEHAPGKLEHLTTYLPHELHIVESYFGGEVIFVYTTAYVEALAKSRRPLQPVPDRLRRGASYPMSGASPPTRGQTRLRGSTGTGGRP